MIRQFRDDDAQTCSDLVRACIIMDPDIAPTTRERLLREETPELMCRRAALFYMAVYELDVAIAGLAGLDLNEIRLLYVDPGHQRRGVGRALIEHLEEMVPAALFAEIFVYSTPVAEGFYRKQGYNSMANHVFDIDGHPLTTVFMIKPNSQ